MRLDKFQAIKLLKTQQYAPTHAHHPRVSPWLICFFLNYSEKVMVETLEANQETLQRYHLQPSLVVLAVHKSIS
jgi:hypothetical protein